MTARSSLAACLLLTLAARDALADAPTIHVVLYTPQGVTAPADAEAKIRQAALYAEAFFIRELTRHGHEPKRKQILTRTRDGEVIVFRAHGSQPPAADMNNKPLEMLQEVWKEVPPEYELERNRPIWWLWVYRGEEHRMSNYRGSGSIDRGGWAGNDYANLDGVVFDTELPMAKGKLDEFTLKGCIHELGHALGLPHLGPLKNGTKGNTLMGPRTAPYRERTKDTSGVVHLSDAAAAMLAHHWLFTNDASQRGVLPELTITDGNTIYDGNTKQIIVTGRVRSTMQPVSVIVTDDSPPKQGEYWRKSYVADVNQDGTFTVKVTEPVRGQGTLRIVFTFPNGAWTGDGKTRALKTAPAMNYHWNGRGYAFRAGS